MTENNEAPRSSSKGLVILLIIVVLILGAVIAILYSKMQDQAEASLEAQELLEDQKVALENDLKSLQLDFGNLKTNNDSLKMLAASQQEHIEKLLKTQADNSYKIRTYQKELATLREVLKSYIIQVDSLNQRNAALRAENTALTSDLQTEKAQNTRLSKQNETLNETVQTAKVLQVSDIQVIGLNSRSKENGRAKNIAKLKTTFTIRANSIAAAGERVFYIVIVKPDKKVLANPSNATFETKEGSQLIYSDKRTVDYQNKDLEVTIYAENDGSFTAGNYTIKIYSEGYLLATNSDFSLK